MTTRQDRGDRAGHDGSSMNRHPCVRNRPWYDWRPSVDETDSYVSAERYDIPAVSLRMLSRASETLQCYYDGLPRIKTRRLANTMLIQKP